MKKDGNWKRRKGGGGDGEGKEEGKKERNKRVMEREERSNPVWVSDAEYTRNG